jgi:hypothetical protein
MKSDRANPGELLQEYGPVVSRVLQRQFPSLEIDVIDSIVFEAVARIWKRSVAARAAGSKSYPSQALFPLILTTAKNLAIDQLRYSPQFVQLSPEILQQAYQEKEEDSGADDPLSAIVSDVRKEVASLEPLDRRILRESMNSRQSESWAHDLAIHLLNEESPSSPSTEIDSEQLSKLAGKLRVRKFRVIAMLRQAMRDKGYDVPDR